VLQQPEGLAAWVRELSPGAVPETVLSISGEVNDVEVELALSWSPTQAERRLKSFVNCGKTAADGSHVDGLLEAVGTTAPSKALGARAVAGLTAVVHVWLFHPRFHGPTRAALEVETARLAVRDVVTRTLAASPWWWDCVAEHDGPKKKPRKH
jgi:DNA gyrase/topoisomerase IV subunit B